MKQYACLKDIQQSDLAPPLAALIEQILTVELSIAHSSRLEADDGAVFLLEHCDTDKTVINQFGAMFHRIPFESIEHISNAEAYLCRLLRDNQCVITLIIPDKKWLPDSWRKKITEELS
ncbi:hypothetical protein HTZ97_07245 [Desulfuromonas acetoxidans]|nr:hypothetical protein [Desulfuromonas acetoxidans]MBF0644515.1 hypothetical protein [Desulfuromonas acetoxidans]NVD23958.1 hypothetical protein [Desulfuromonas acetoxidans]NVE16255.1 hypothetical protein [Desulfuromonas acetoxidans]